MYMNIAICFQITFLTCLLVALPNKTTEMAYCTSDICLQRFFNIITTNIVTNLKSDLGNRYFINFTSIGTFLWISSHMPTQLNCLSVLLELGSSKLCRKEQIFFISARACCVTAVRVLSCIWCRATTFLQQIGSFHILLTLQPFFVVEWVCNVLQYSHTLQKPSK